MRRNSLWNATVETATKSVTASRSVASQSASTDSSFAALLTASLPRSGEHDVFTQLREKKGSLTENPAVSSFEKSLTKTFSTFPIVGALAHLFGSGEENKPAPLPVYQAPEALNFEFVYGRGAAHIPSSPTSSLAANTPSNAFNSSASDDIDAQFFLDRSQQIADAVQQALLNSHPLAALINEL